MLSSLIKAGAQECSDDSAPDYVLILLLWALCVHGEQYGQLFESLGAGEEELKNLLRDHPKEVKALWRCRAVAEILGKPMLGKLLLLRLGEMLIAAQSASDLALLVKAANTLPKWAFESADEEGWDGPLQPEEESGGRMQPLFGFFDDPREPDLERRIRNMRQLIEVIASPPTYHPGLGPDEEPPPDTPEARAKRFEELAWMMAGGVPCEDDSEVGRHGGRPH